MWYLSNEIMKKKIFVKNMDITWMIFFKSSLYKIIVQDDH
jgi:hypothetical protein